jgi:hypothetical protein
MSMDMNMDVTERLNLTPPEAPQKTRSTGCLGLFARSVLLLIALILGVILGTGGMLLYLANTKPNAPLPATPLTQDAIQVQMSSAYLTQLLRKQRLADDISNLQVQTTADPNQPLIVSGDQKVTVIFFPVIRKFTLTLQPLAKACQLTLHLLKADSDGLPVTSFVSSLESQFNETLKVNLSRFPQGFTYCTNGAKTDSNGLSISYTATPA